MKMEIKYFSRTNRSRNKSFQGDTIAPTMSEWACALAGEAGEVCDAIKKLSLLYAGTIRKDITEDTLIDNIGKEIADTIIYCDLLADHFNLDLEDIIKAKFNERSEKWNMEQRL